MDINTHILNSKVRHFRANKIKNQIYKTVLQTNQEFEEVESQLREVMGITKNQLTSWLKNSRVQPSIEQFTELAQLLSCSIDDLVETSSEL